MLLSVALERKLADTAYLAAERLAARKGPLLPAHVDALCDGIGPGTYGGGCAQVDQRVRPPRNPPQGPSSRMLSGSSSGLGPLSTRTLPQNGESQLVLNPEGPQSTPRLSNTSRPA